MSEFTDLFPSPVLLNYAKNNIQLKQFPLESLFPSRKVQTDDIMTVVDKTYLPTAAHIHAWDTEAERTDFEREAQTLELFHVKKKKVWGEKEMRQIRMDKLNPLLSDLDALSGVMRASVSLVNDVNTTFEIMRVKALTEGKFNLKNEAGANVPFDYSLPKDQQLTANATVDFSSDDVDPISVLLEWVESANFPVTRGLTSTKVLAAIRNNKNVVERIKGSNATIKSVMPNELTQYLLSQGLPNIVEYKGSYLEKNKQGKLVKTNYIADGALALFGDGEIGETIYGLTEDESMLINSGVISNNMVNDVMIRSFSSSQDPISNTVLASAIAVPSLAARYQLLQATVLPTK